MKLRESYDLRECEVWWRMAGLWRQTAVCYMKAAALAGKLWSQNVWQKHLPGGSQRCWRTVERLTKALEPWLQLQQYVPESTQKRCFAGLETASFSSWPWKKGLTCKWNFQIWDSVQTAEIIQTCQITTDCHCLRPAVCGVYRSGFQYEKLQKPLRWKLKNNIENSSVFWG